MFMLIFYTSMLCYRSGSLPTFIGTFVNNSNELIPLSTDNNFIVDNKLLFDSKPMETNRQVSSSIIDLNIINAIKNNRKVTCKYKFSFC